MRRSKIELLTTSFVHVDDRQGFNNVSILIAFECIKNHHNLRFCRIVYCSSTATISLRLKLHDAVLAFLVDVSENNPPGQLTVGDCLCSSNGKICKHHIIILPHSS